MGDRYVDIDIDVDMDVDSDMAVAIGGRLRVGIWLFLSIGCQFLCWCINMWYRLGLGLVRYMVVSKNGSLPVDYIGGGPILGSLKGGSSRFGSRFLETPK